MAIRLVLNVKRRGIAYMFRFRVKFSAIKYKLVWWRRWCKWYDRGQCILGYRNEE